MMSAWPLASAAPGPGTSAAPVRSVEKGRPPSSAAATPANADTAISPMTSTTKRPRRARFLGGETDLASINGEPSYATLIRDNQPRKLPPPANGSEPFPGQPYPISGLSLPWRAGAATAATPAPRRTVRAMAYSRSPTAARASSQPANDTSFETRPSVTVAT
jgi:hypothetical protein